MSNGNLPAHPFVANELTEYVNSEYGLTKREYFAGLAMQAMISSEHYISASTKLVAECALHYADALLEELDK